MNTSKHLAALALDTIMSLGADAAQVSAALSTLNELNATQDGMSLMRTTHDTAITIACIKDHKKGSIAINDGSAAAIEAACRTCLESLRDAEPDEAWEFCSEPTQKTTVGGASVDPDLMYDRVDELLTQVQQQYPLIQFEAIIVDHRQSDATYLNSHQVCYESQKSRYHASFSFVAAKDGQSSSFAGFSAYSKDLAQPLLDMDGAREAFENAQKLIAPKAYDSKITGQVLLSPDCFADLLFSLLENTVADGVMLDGTSLWKDKLNQKVLDNKLTVRLHPHDERMVIMAEHTAEGYPAKDFTLLDKGVLKSFLLSKYIANKTGKEPAPNDSSAIIIEGGVLPMRDLIANVRDGLYVGYFSGGQPVQSGEFSGVAKNAFRIKDGKIAEGVTETMISGNLIDMFNRVIGLSQETLSNGTAVIPWALVDGVTISGK